VAVVVDTSVLLDYFRGRPVPRLTRALDGGFLFLPPLVVSEIVSGDLALDQKVALAELLQVRPDFHIGFMWANCATGCGVRV